MAKAKAEAPGVTVEQRLQSLEERVAELEWARANPLSAAMQGPGRRVDRSADRQIVTISAASASQEDTTATHGPDGLPIKDTRAPAIPVRPRIRHIHVEG
jgi:hypothetical protein